VRVVRDPNTNMGIGIGYVLFKTKAAARAALELNGTALNKRPMRISRINKQPISSGGGSRAPAGGWGSRAGNRPGPGGTASGRRGPGGALGVRQGGVQKRQGFGRPSGAKSAGDWQGLQTKGKGAKMRQPKAAGASTAGGPRGGSGSRPAGGGGPPRAAGKGAGKPAGKGAKGKRPAVAARKAAQRAKAAKKK
jgi:nucleolar protein 12